MIYAVLSCKHNKPTVSREKLVAVITDLHLAESAAFISASDVNAQNLTAMRLYRDVINKHDISVVDFWATYEIYKSSPKEMNELYEKVIERLNETK
jgi:hypothetical protein